MGQLITKDNYRSVCYDVFQKFTDQWPILTAGTIDNFNSMTIGWGMMGNVWGHPGSGLTVYVQPSRYTFEFMEKYDYFTVSFLPKSHHEAAKVLGRLSGRDGDKITPSGLTPKALENGVGFEEAELTFVCRKICSQPFQLECCPEHMQKGMYASCDPHYMYIGFIEDAFGDMKEWEK